MHNLPILRLKQNKTNKKPQQQNKTTNQHNSNSTQSLKCYQELRLMEESRKPNSRIIFPDGKSMSLTSKVKI